MREAGSYPSAMSSSTNISIALVSMTLVLASACSKRKEAQPSDTDTSDTQSASKSKQEAPSDTPLPTLKKGFKTAFLTPNTDVAPPVNPPDGIFELIKFPSPLGENSAYVSPQIEGPKRPAIIWIQGGFEFGIGPSAWEPSPRENDQSASVFRESGIVLMLPSLRGNNDSPGSRECFLGEVDDVIAAGKYLAKRSDVDPERIYLGGHSTGGTMAVLVAVSSDAFRGVFAFGPALGALVYHHESCPTDLSDIEGKLRTAAYFLRDIKTPTYLIEGESGNGPYYVPSEFKGDAPITTIIVPDADHFSVLRPGSEVVVDSILADKGASAAFSISAAAITARMGD